MFLTFFESYSKSFLNASKRRIGEQLPKLFRFTLSVKRKVLVIHVFYMRSLNIYRPREFASKSCAWQHIQLFASIYSQVRHWTNTLTSISINASST